MVCDSVWVIKIIDRGKDIGYHSAFENKVHAEYVCGKLNRSLQYVFRYRVKETYPIEIHGDCAVFTDYPGHLKVRRNLADFSCMDFMLSGA